MARRSRIAALTTAQSFAEAGIDIARETPKPVDPHLVRHVDLVVTLGRQARVDPVPGTAFENWDTVEPSERGTERVRLIRDHIAARTAELAR